MVIGSESWYEMVRDDGKYILDGKDNIIILKWIKFNCKIIFKVNCFEPYANEFQDCTYGAEVIDSDPKQPYFNYLYTLKSIRENTTLLTYCQTFENRLSPEIMNQHKISMQNFFESMKSTCESD